MSVVDIFHMSVVDIMLVLISLLRFPLQLDSGQTIECTVAKYFLERYKMKLQ